MTIMHTRRHFLSQGASAASVAALAAITPRALRAWDTGAPAGIVLPRPLEDPRYAEHIKELVAAALQEARQAGATYADIRITHTSQRQVIVEPKVSIEDFENLVAGVRALTNGYWGFASASIGNTTAMARLGREAVLQAKSNRLSQAQQVDLIPVPVVRDGQWTTPVEIDPFAMHPVEVVDYLRALSIYIAHFPGGRAKENACALRVQDKTFGSTEGTYCTQRLYRTSGKLVVTYKDPKTGLRTEAGLDSLTPAGMGFELYERQPIKQQIRQLFTQMTEDFSLPVKPVEPDHYDMVFDAWGVSGLVSQTIGAATELDRMLGYEANAGGTSYLKHPKDVLNSFVVANPHLTVTTNRDELGGAATTRWDDDGVLTEEFPLVRDGVIQGVQTTRESAAWLQEFTSASAPIASGGGAYANDASFVPITHTGNLRMLPGSGDDTFDSLVAAMGKGVAIRYLGAQMDFQQLNGFAQGQAYEVKNGKRVALLTNGAILFRTPELWKNITQLGGVASTRRFGHEPGKGEPYQSGCHSVTAVPAAFKNLSFINSLRKA